MLSPVFYIDKDTDKKFKIPSLEQFLERPECIKLKADFEKAKKEGKGWFLKDDKIKLEWFKDAIGEPIKTDNAMFDMITNTAKLDGIINQTILLPANILNIGITGISQWRQNRKNRNDGLELLAKTCGWKETKWKDVHKKMKGLLKDDPTGTNAKPFQTMLNGIMKGEKDEGKQEDLLLLVDKYVDKYMPNSQEKTAKKMIEFAKDGMDYYQTTNQHMKMVRELDPILNLVGPPVWSTDMHDIATNKDNFWTMQAARDKLTKHNPFNKVEDFQSAVEHIKNNFLTPFRPAYYITACRILGEKRISPTPTDVNVLYETVERAKFEVMNMIGSIDAMYPPKNLMEKNIWNILRFKQHKKNLKTKQDFMKRMQLDSVYDRNDLRNADLDARHFAKQYLGDEWKQFAADTNITLPLSEPPPAPQADYQKEVEPFLKSIFETANREDVVKACKKITKKIKKEQKASPIHLKRDLNRFSYILSQYSNASPEELKDIIFDKDEVKDKIKDQFNALFRAVSTYPQLKEVKKILDDNEDLKNPDFKELKETLSNKIDELKSGIGDQIKKEVAEYDKQINKMFRSEGLIKYIDTIDKNKYIGRQATLPKISDLSDVNYDVNVMNDNECENEMRELLFRLFTQAIKIARNADDLTQIEAAYNLTDNQNLLGTIHYPDLIAQKNAKMGDLQTAKVQQYDDEINRLTDINNPANITDLNMGETLKKLESYIDNDPLLSRNQKQNLKNTLSLEIPALLNAIEGVYRNKSDDIIMGILPTQHTGNDFAKFEEEISKHTLLKNTTELNNIIAHNDTNKATRLPIEETAYSNEITACTTLTALNTFQNKLLKDKLFKDSSELDNLLSEIKTRKSSLMGGITLTDYDFLSGSIAQLRSVNNASFLQKQINKTFPIGDPRIDQLTNELRLKANELNKGREI